jgi:hypothetical protein
MYVYEQAVPPPGFEAYHSGAPKSYLRKRLVNMRKDENGFISAVGQLTQEELEEINSPTEMCPAPPNYRVCSFWGDPHYSTVFKDNQTNVHGRRGRFGMNHYGLGLFRLFGTKDKHLEAQAFFCDARGHTSSLAGLAVKIDGSIAMWRRNKNSGPAYGNHLRANQYINGDAHQSELGFSVRNESGLVQNIPYDFLGSFPLERFPTDIQELKDKGYNLENNGNLADGSQPLNGKGWVNQDLFAHQAIMKDVTPRRFAVAPMCVGDVHDSVLVKTYNPRVGYVYEPVTSIEVSGYTFDNLEDVGLCNVGVENQGKEIDPNYAEVTAGDSLFSVDELFELCGTCGMLDDSDALGIAGQGKNFNSKDKDGYAGCSPQVQPNAITGLQNCQEQAEQDGKAKLVEAAEQQCKRFPKETEWFDDCLMEFCNTEDPNIAELVAEAQAELEAESRLAMKANVGLRAAIYQLPNGRFPGGGNACQLPEGLIGDYNGLVAVKDDEHINYGSTGGPPPGEWDQVVHGDLPKDRFLIRWNGHMQVPITDRYHFQLNSDDGSRMWLRCANQSEWTKVVNNDGCHAMRKTEGTIELTGPQSCEVQIESVESGGGWGVVWEWYHDNMEDLTNVFGSMHTGKPWQLVGGLSHDVPPPSDASNLLDESDGKLMAPPSHMCPHPPAYKVCSIWGDPHYSTLFKDAKSNNQNRGNLINHYQLGLYRLFKSDDGLIEAQGFFCDARGHTTSICGLALSVRNKTVVWKRHRMSGPAYGHHIKASQFIHGDPEHSALGLTIDGVTLPYGDLGPFGLEEVLPSPEYDTAFGGVRPVSKGGEVNEGWHDDNFYAQQMALPRDHDRAKAVAPTCVGDQNGDVVVKSHVPKVGYVYEPVITIELAGSVDLAEQGLCNIEGTRYRQNVDDNTLNGLNPPLESSESLFSVDELFELCGVCGMLDSDAVSGTYDPVKTHRTDADGWVGCNPNKEPEPPTTGEERCKERQETCTTDKCSDIVEKSKNKCSRFKKDEAWYDACRIEFCNSDDDDVAAFVADAEDNAELELAPQPVGFVAKVWPMFDLANGRWAKFGTEEQQGGFDRCHFMGRGQRVPFMEENYLAKQEVTKIDVPSNGDLVSKRFHGWPKTGPFKDVKDFFIVSYQGTLNVTISGNYEFQLISDDASMMYLEESGGNWRPQPVIGNSGLHGMRSVNSGVLDLAEGEYKVQIDSCEWGGGWGVIWKWKTPAGGSGQDQNQFQEQRASSDGFRVVGN